MKWLRYVCCYAFLSTQVIADNSSMSFSIPSISSVSGSDSIRAGDLDCKNSIGGTTNFELGMTGIINNAVTPLIGKEGDNPQTKDIGLYARIIIPLDGPKERINCNTLYQLELQRRRLEVQKYTEVIIAISPIEKSLDANQSIKEK